jgi:integral membrane sensor domain MASE1
MSSTTIGYLLSLALVVFIFTQIKERPFRLFDLVRPLVIVALVAALFLRSFPTQGNDVAFILLSTIIGATLGALCGLTTNMRVKEGVVLSSVGAIAIFFWCIGVVARSVFSFSVEHGGRAAIGHFSVQHHITDNGWVTALVLMALAEVVARTITLTARAKKETGRSLGQIFAKDDAAAKPTPAQ